VPVSRIIVVNDGSLDESVEKVESFNCPSHLKLELINQDNKGVSSARNKGLKESTSMFVCFLDADDEWHPSFVEKMLELISDFPDAGLYCLGHLVNESGQVYKPKHGVDDGFRGYLDNFFTASARGSVANSSKIAVRKSLAQSLGGFPESVIAGEDLFLWIQLAIHGSVVCDSITAVTVYREFDANRSVRTDSVPYPVEYYSLRRRDLREVKGLKQYLVKVGMLHVVGAAIEKNYSGFFKRLSALSKISPLHGVLLLPVILIPARVFHLIKIARTRA
jgi:glycosyltransferase involved in cell wall biosynthesis